MDNRNMRGENAFLLITEALLKHHKSGRLLVTSPEATFNQFAITADECCYLDFHHYNNSDPISLRREIQDSLHKEIEELQTLEGNFDTMICFNAWLALHENKQIGKSYLNAALRALDDGGRLIIPATHNFMRFPYWEETRNFILDNYHLSRVVYPERRELGLAGISIIEIINIRSDDSTHYYISSKFNSFNDMLSAVREKTSFIEVRKEVLKHRWAVQFVDPQYDQLRKKYLSKDTVKIQSLAQVMGGALIRPEERKEIGEYLILSPRLISDGKINYDDERAYYADFKDERNFTRGILKEGDIVVCNLDPSNKMNFFIYHEERIKVVAGMQFFIIRAEGENQRYLQLYFGTDLGKDNFNRQVEMLGGSVTLTRLTARELSSIVVPNIKTLETASRIQESNNLINKISMLFESEGWEVIKEYRPKNDCRLEFDIALKTRGKVVGVVEAKRNKALGADRKLSIKESAEQALRIGNIQFFILFINDAMYRYKDNEFFRIPEIPTPLTYKQYDKQEEFYVSNVDDSDVKEIPEGTAPISDSYLILSAISNLGQMLGDKIDAVQKTVDSISAQIQELSGRISIYQDLVEKQLEYAKDDLEEQERILKVFTDTCVERVTEKIRSEYAIELYTDQKKKLIDSMGEAAWNKLEADTQNFLVSSKVMYEKLVGISEIVDYSGVCLLVTKALELELAKRFCQNYISYYKTTYPGKAGRDNAPLPIINKYHKYIKAHDFTLGSFPFVVGSQFIADIEEDDKENIKNKIVEYVRQGVLKTFSLTHSDDEILELLSDYADDVERVRKDYRNPSAHTNALTKVSAKECFDLVLDVEKLLKKMLDSFDE